ncbi:MAG: hypothetical protein R2746_11500 [Acidimicrobiales bacterium]
MTWQHDTMMNPPIEELLDRARLKFRWSRWVPGGNAGSARTSASWATGWSQLVPPQITSVARKPLSIAFEEIAADKIEAVEIDPEALAAEAQAEAIPLAPPRR